VHAPTSPSHFITRAAFILRCTVLGAVHNTRGTIMSLQTLHPGPDRRVHNHASPKRDTHDRHQQCGQCGRKTVRLQKVQGSSTDSRARIRISHHTSGSACEPHSRPPARTAGHIAGGVCTPHPHLRPQLHFFRSRRARSSRRVDVVFHPPGAAATPIPHLTSVSNPLPFHA